MDFITTGVIASTVYDVLKAGAKLSAGVLKERLGKWLNRPWFRRHLQAS
ncbi:hypothetical protein [Pseudomonas oryzihabitans]